MGSEMCIRDSRATSPTAPDRPGRFPVVTCVPVDEDYNFPRSELAAMAKNIARLIDDIDRLDINRRNMMDELQETSPSSTTKSTQNSARLYGNHRRRTQQQEARKAAQHRRGRQQHTQRKGRNRHRPPHRQRQRKSPPDQQRAQKKTMKNSNRTPREDTDQDDPIILIFEGFIDCWYVRKL